MIFSKSITQYDVFLLVQERGHKQGIKEKSVFQEKVTFFWGNTEIILFQGGERCLFQGKREKLDFSRGKKEYIWRKIVI